MNCLTEKLFNFFSSFKILKIIIIFTLSININCLERSTPSTYSAKDVSIIISPYASLVAPGDDLQFTATLHNSDGSTEDVTSEATWATTNTAVTTISNSPGSEGLATAIAEGATKITAEFGNISDTTNLIVTADDPLEPVIVSIEISPTGPSVDLGDDQQFYATAHYSDASTEDVTSQVTWTATNSAVATISNSAGSEGLATSMAVGATKIQATLGEISDTTILTVDLELVSIDILPGSRTIADTDTIQYTAIGTFADSSTSDITDQVTWSSTDTGVATISNSAGSEGLAAGAPGAEGTTTIQATMDSVSDSVCLRVTNSTAWELEVTTTDVNQDITIWFYDGPVNMTIYWGDCTMETATGGVFFKEITHTYSSAGTYTLRLRGTASRISFSPAWQRLTGILSVVQGIDGLTSFNSSFQSCMNLKGSIPAGLFDNATQVTNFQTTFFGCSGLTGPIPAGLFDNHPQVTTFWLTFGDCPGLTGPIPAGLFDNNTLVTSFQATFWNCSGLTGPIPAGLFDNNTLVTTFQGTFSGCTGLTSIPAGLFNNNTNNPIFNETFKNATGITSAVPTLWISHPGSEHTECFNGVTNASNYGAIPADWK